MLRTKETKLLAKMESTNKNPFLVPVFRKKKMKDRQRREITGWEWNEMTAFQISKRAC